MLPIPLNRLIYTFTLSVILALVLWAAAAQYRQHQTQKQAAAAEIARLSGSLNTERQRAAAYRYAAETLNTALQTQQAQHAAAAHQLQQELHYDQTAKDWGSSPVPSRIGRLLDHPAD